MNQQQSAMVAVATIQIRLSLLSDFVSRDAQTSQAGKEILRKERKRKRKKGKDYVFWRHIIEKPSIIPGCPNKKHLCRTHLALCWKVQKGEKKVCAIRRHDGSLCAREAAQNWTVYVINNYNVCEMNIAGCYIVSQARGSCIFW